MQEKATRIIVDVESIPDQRPGAVERAIASIKVPGNYKNADTIAKYLDENSEKAWRDTALNGGYGELIIIGYALDDGEVQTLMRHHGDPEAEAVMLADFWNSVQEGAVAAPTWVGHNVLFDIQMLRHRSLVLGVPIPSQLPWAPQPWSPHVFCTSHSWTWDRNRGISLAELAGILGIEAKTAGITGADVWDYAQEGRYDELVDYCKEDVSVTRQVYERLRPVR